MRHFSLISATMLIALLAAAPASAEEEAATAPTEAMGEIPEAVAVMKETDAHPEDPGMAEAAAEQEAMEAESAVETETPLDVAPPVSDAPAMTAESETAMESDTVTHEVITGTVVETTGPAAPPPEDMNIPVRGMHMDQVEKMYGKPVSINPPVGEPPITRWDYPGYSVYFEYSYVIQSVGKR